VGRTTLRAPRCKILTTSYVLRTSSRQPAPCGSQMLEGKYAHAPRPRPRHIAHAQLRAGITPSVAAAAPADGPTHRRPPEFEAALRRPRQPATAPAESATAPGESDGLFGAAVWDDFEWAHNRPPGFALNRPLQPCPYAPQHASGQPAPIERQQHMRSTLAADPQRQQDNMQTGSCHHA
jgi:hypothetical protein